MFNRYLEFDSTYRDRKMWPLPSQFEILISQTGQNNRYNAKDPVSNASPIFTWNNSFQETTASNTTGAVITVTAASGTPSESGETTFQITAAAGILRQPKNFYVGCTLSILSGGVTYSRRILHYEYLGGGPPQVAIVTLNSALPDALVGLTAFFITNPTPLATSSASPAVIKLFIPSGSFIDNFYYGYYVESLGPTVDNQVARLITAYDGVNRLATLESNTPGDWRAILNANNNFVIRKELPAVSNASIPTLTTLGTSAVNDVKVSLASSTSASLDLINSYIRMMTPYPTTAPGFTTAVAPYSEQNRIVNYLADSGTFTAAAATSFTFSASASSVDNYYKGCFIITNVPEVYEILTYTGATRTGTVSSAFVTAFPVTASWVIRTISLDEPFTTSPSPGPPTANVYELEIFTRDNSVPFTFTGTLVSSQETVCYEVELLNLILPNITLVSGRGGRSAFYPYMYVELQQISAPSAGGNKGIIYSNNPNAYRMLYRVPMDDTSAPLVSTFIKVDGDGMVHTIKFRPNDSFKFAVYHASGELFQTEMSDFYAPTAPNPLVQISACFSFKKV